MDVQRCRAVLRRWGPEAALLSAAVAVFVTHPQRVPAPTAPPFDNVWMGEKTARLANEGPAALLVLNDPWFRYVPQAMLLVALPLGRVSVGEAIRLTALYVRFVEGVVLPVAVLATARRLSGRETGLASLAVVLGGRLLELGPSLGFSPMGFAPVRLLVEAVKTLGLVAGVVPFAWYQVVVVFGTAAAWLIARRWPSREDLHATLAGVVTLAATVTAFRWHRMFTDYPTTYAFTNHWYWGLTGPFAVAALYGAGVAATWPREPWRPAVGAGVALGFVASIQLAQGFVVAGAVGAALAVHGAWRTLGVTAGASLLVWSPTPVVAALNRQWYRSQGVRVVDVAVADVPSVFVTLVLALAFVRAGRGVAETVPHEATLLAAVVGGWTAAQIVDLVFGWYWTEFVFGVLKPFVLLLLAVGLNRARRAVGADLRDRLTPDVAG